jgi:hypothetical protein
VPLKENIMNHRVVRIAAAMACVGVHQLAQCADTLFAYDGFNYGLGAALAGQSGGSGWAGAWASNAGTGGAAIVSGLEYTDTAGQVLPTAGGAIRTNPSVFFSQEVRDTSQVFGEAGTPVWVSFLVQQAPNPAAGTNYAAVALGKGLTFGSEAMNGGVYGSEVAVGAFYTNIGSQVPGYTAPANSVSFIVLRYDFAASGNDTINLWVNPLLSGVSAVPDASGALRDYAPTFSGITLDYGDFKAFVYDELRIGSSFGAVTAAVPEPQTLALLLAGFGVVLSFAHRARCG